MHESSQKKVAFLDLNVSLENGCITTDLYSKCTDYQQYLHCSSAHSDHLKNFYSNISSQALRDSLYYEKISKNFESRWNC